MASTQYTLGERIRELRNGWLSQEELAAKAGVSVDLIRKLEQGQRHTASVLSLQKIAWALDVQILLAKPTPPPSMETDSGIVAIRNALFIVDDLVESPEPEAEPTTLAEAQRTVDYLWAAYWQGQYELLTTLLPHALAELRATRRDVPAAEKPAMATLLARTYQVTGDTLVHIGQIDAAFFAIREALKIAKKSGDPLASVALRVSMAWQLLVQGNFERSTQVAMKAAGEVEPRGKVSDSQLAAYGILTVTAATAYARQSDKDTTADLLAESAQVANRIGREVREHQTTFGPAKVTMLAVDCAVVQDDYARALKVAKQLPQDADIPLATRARNLADVSLSHLRLGHPAKALDALRSAEEMASDWFKYQTLPRQIVLELRSSKKGKLSGLGEFAAKIGVNV